jgi:hypothetical protein
VQIGPLVIVLVLGLLMLGRVARSPRARLGCAGVLLGIWLIGLVWRVLPFNARAIELAPLAGWSVVYFPGDPPWADVLLGLAEVLSLLTAVLWVVAYAIRRLLPLHRAWENILAAPLLVGLASTVLATGAISSRHFGEWRELRAELARYSDMVAKAAPDPSRLLTHAEYETIKGLFTSEPTFVSRGFQEPLKIRMMQTYPPYVGVDFGAGRNAVFDLTTMVCTYSD